MLRLLAFELFISPLFRKGGLKRVAMTLAVLFFVLPWLMNKVAVPFIEENIPSSRADVGSPGAGIPPEILKAARGN